jgi:hypothetical protein
MRTWTRAEFVYSLEGDGMPSLRWTCVTLINVLPSAYKRFLTSAHVSSVLLDLSWDAQ